MSSASNGRKNRPRSAGNIFQIGKPPHRDPQRRESTESTRRAQRAVADCRMVGLRHVSASSCMHACIHGSSCMRGACFVRGTVQQPRACRMHQLQRGEKTEDRLKIAICTCISKSGCVADIWSVQNCGIYRYICV